MRSVALVLAAVLTSCAPVPPKISVDDARAVVAAYVAHRDWTIMFETPRNVVRDGILYYAVGLAGTGKDVPQRLFVSSETGDLYDAEFHSVGFASELLPSGPAVMAPAGSQ